MRVTLFTSADEVKLSPICSREPIVLFTRSNLDDWAQCFHLELNQKGEEEEVEWTILKLSAPKRGDWISPITCHLARRRPCWWYSAVDRVTIRERETAQDPLVLARWCAIRSWRPTVIDIDSTGLDGRLLLNRFPIPSFVLRGIVLIQRETLIGERAPIHAEELSLFIGLVRFCLKWINYIPFSFRVVDAQLFGFVRVTTRVSLSLSLSHCA